jgi:hypothetical protein
MNNETVFGIFIGASIVLFLWLFSYGIHTAWDIEYARSHTCVEIKKG